MPFEFNGISVRSVLDEHGEPWFVASDVARVLGYSETSAMTRTLDDDEKGLRNLHTPGGEQSLVVISESGLYSAILRSRVPKAKEFKRWVTSVLLPTLRKTGTFQVERLTPLQLAEKLVDAERRVEAANAKVLELEGPAAHAETFRAAEGLCTIGDLANRFQVWAKVEHPDVKVLHKDVFDHAALCGLIIRGNTVRHNQPTSQGIKAGWVKAHRAEYDTDTRGMQTTVSTRLTSRGEARLWDHLVAYVKANQTLAIRKAS